MREFAPQSEDAPMRWLMTIARHHIVDLLRAQNSLKRGAGAMPARNDDDSGVISLLETLAVYHRTPSKSAAAHELAIALERSIDRLPAAYRQAISLRHVDGLPAKQAAARMNRTEGAFHLLCNRGLKMLRVEMRSESIYV
jgi:RNA polymerase sigma factor (sigma-70 family)